MTTYYYGCDEAVGGWGRYYERCNALELDLSKQGHMPTIATLNRWRVKSPRHFAFVLHLEETIAPALAAASERGARKLPPAVGEALERSAERARAVAAKAHFIATPMEMTPGEDSKALLKATHEKLNEKLGKAALLLWEPSGLWEREQACDWARGVGIVAARDPFLAMREGEACGHGDACLVVNERAGMRRKFDQYDFEALLDWSSSAQRVFVLLRGRFKAHHAKEFSHVLRAYDAEREALRREAAAEQE